MVVRWFWEPEVVSSSLAIPIIAEWSGEVPAQPHKLCNVGSNPTSAIQLITNNIKERNLRVCENENKNVENLNNYASVAKRYGNGLLTRISQVRILSDAVAE